MILFSFFKGEIARERTQRTRAHSREATKRTRESCFVKGMKRKFILFSFRFFSTHINFKRLKKKRNWRKKKKRFPEMCFGFCFGFLCS
jgi:hypothetical protein